MLCSSGSAMWFKTRLPARTKKDNFNDGMKRKVINRSDRMHFIQYQALTINLPSRQNRQDRNGSFAGKITSVTRIFSEGKAVESGLERAGE